ncbi:MAG: allophanate hydrolase [Rhodospirillaceae bacterium]|nr:allophanate hydrolase [Rhodospirillaceae bacterium]
MTIKVLDGGFNVTIQDMGRPRFQHLGVPVSGAVSEVLLALANALVGNPRNMAGLEIRMLGPTLEVLCETIRVALVGTSTPIEVVNESGVSHPSNQSVLLKKGQKFKIGNITDSGSAYLAIEGGFNIPSVYGSLSTYIRAGIGGLNGRAIVEGDEIPLQFGSVSSRGELKLENDAALDQQGPIRIIFGPQQDFFTEDSVDKFLNSAYSVTRDADRMGIRLDGPKLEHRRGYNIVSDGIVTGAIQVPGTGQPIVLLADHQTTGGYPKLATVISSDISRLGRLRPDDQITFIEVSVEEAEAARFDRENKLQNLIENLSVADPWLDEKALYSENLISGFS